MNNYFDILETIYTDLRTSNYGDFKNKISELENSLSTINQNLKLRSIFIYHFLNILQWVDSFIISKTLGQKDSKIMNTVPAKIRTILGKLLKEEIDLSEVCGREFLRFLLDKPLISEFHMNGITSIKSFFRPPSPEFIANMIPKDIQKSMDEYIHDPELIRNIVKQFQKSDFPAAIDFFVCDAIRYVFSYQKKIQWKTKLNIIKSLLALIPNWNVIISTFEFSMVLCLDILSYQRKLNEDDFNIKIVFSLMNDFPDLLTFVANIAIRSNQNEILYSLAEAKSRHKKQNIFQQLSLPEVEEAPTVDVKAALKSAVESQKWTTDATVPAKFAQTVYPNLASCFFDIPFKPSDDLQAIIDSKRPEIIASICIKSVNIFAASMYLLENDIEVASKTLKAIANTEIPSFIYQGISKVLIVFPELLEHFLEILPQIPNSLDPSPFIRYISYNCNNKEIEMIFKKRMTFPNSTELITNLLKQSTKWKDLPQNIFWSLIFRIYQNSFFTLKLIEGFEASLNQISKSPVALLNLNHLIARNQPSPQLSPLIELFMRGGTELQNSFISILSSWYNASPEETITILKNRRKTFRSFLENLSPQQKSNIPDEISKKESL